MYCYHHKHISLTLYHTPKYFIRVSPCSVPSSGQFLQLQETSVLSVSLNLPFLDIPFCFQYSRLNPRALSWNYICSHFVLRHCLTKSLTCPGWAQTWNLPPSASQSADYRRKPLHPARDPLRRRSKYPYCLREQMVP